MEYKSYPQCSIGSFDEGESEFFVFSLKIQVESTSFFVSSCRTRSRIFSMSTCGGEAAGFSTNFDRSASLSWRYFAISRVTSSNSLSETVLSFNACETQQLIESCFAVARERSRECLSTLRSMFLLRTARLVEEKPAKAAKPATGAPMITPTPVREAAMAPEERAAETAPRPTAE